MITEYGDRYILGLHRLRVERVLLGIDGTSVELRLTGGTRVKVEGPMRFSTHLAGAPSEVVLPLAALAEVESATLGAGVAFKSGQLRLTFSTGRVLQNLKEPETSLTLSEPGRPEWSWRGGSVTSPQPRFSLDGETGAWTLPIDRVAVDRLIIDAATTVEFENGWLLRLECPFTFTDADGGEHELVPDYDAVELAPVLALKRAVGHAGRMFTDGRMEVSFVDGSAVHVPVDENFDAWTVHGPGGIEVVSVAGGGLEISGAATPADGAAPTHGR